MRRMHEKNPWKDHGITPDRCTRIGISCQDCKTEYAQQVEYSPDVVKMAYMIINSICGRCGSRDVAVSVFVPDWKAPVAVQPLNTRI